MRRRAWEWWVDEASSFAAKDKTKLVLRSTIPMQAASCSRIGSWLSTKNCLCLPQYILLCYELCHAHYLSSNMDAKIPSIDPSGILHLTSTYN
jgi:hypothetical protein